MILYGVRKRFINVLLVATVTSPQSIQAQPGTQSVSASLRGLVARGDAYCRKGDYDSGIKLYSDVIRQQPGFAGAYIARGAAYHANRIRDKALADFNRAIELDPKSARAYCDRADLEETLLHEPEKALADYDEAIRLAPDFQRAFFNRGAHFKVRHDYQRAIADFNHAIKLMPNDFSAYGQRAYCYARHGDRVRAAADANVAIKLKPNTNVYLWRAVEFRLRANGYRILGKHDLALKDLHDSIRVGAKDAEAYYALAWFQATCPDDRFRNGAQAVSTAKTACELLRWGDSGSIDGLAAAYAEAGEFEQAVKYEKQSLADSSLAPKEREQREKRLTLFEQQRPFRDEF